MSETEILKLIETVNRRRSDGSVSPTRTPAAHAQLVEDFDKLVTAGYRLGANDKWIKAS